MNELSIQQKESLEESQHIVQDHERGKQAQAAVDNLQCSEASKQENEVQDVLQESGRAEKRTETESGEKPA